LHLSRRSLLTGAAVGGGLLVAWLAWPDDQASPLTPRPGEHRFGAWLSIGRDGVVTVAVPQVEMGQGVTTLLPQIVAEELGADWRLVAVQPAPPVGAYANVPLAARWAPLWMPLAPSLADAPDDWLAARFAQAEMAGATAAGTTLAAYEDACRRAGAAARAMLAEAAANRWSVPVEECRVAGGQVTHGTRRLTFGALAAEAAELSPPDDPPLRPRAPTAPSAAGRPTAAAFPRLDLPSKATGAALFAGDVRLPGMLFASIRHGPVGRPELAAFDADAAAGIGGLKQVVKSRRWLAAAADNWWAADRALTAMRPRFAGAEPADSKAMAEALDAALAEEGERIALVGAEPGANGPRAYTAIYRIAPAVHASIETASATARLVGGQLELWMAAQAPTQALEAAAKAVGVKPENAVLYPVAAGGSFDARLNHLHAIEAAVIAQAVGRPVQLTWPRRQELLALPPRAPVHARLSGTFEGGGAQRVASLHARYAAPLSMREFGHRLFDNATPESAIEAAEGAADPLSLEGAVPPYAIGRVAVDHVPVTLPLPTGPLRGNGPAVTAFCNESFVDELAARAGREPLSYRINMLGHDPRLVACLLQVAGMATWDGARRTSGQGLACVRMRGTAGVSWRA
jgi:isoquinoline 1-oxidoreductase beta subunit